MKQFLIILMIAAVGLQGCKKDKNHVDPDIHFSVPSDNILSYNNPIPALDIDGDGIRDAGLAVYLYMEDGWTIEHYYIYPEDHADIAVQNEDDGIAFEANKSIAEGFTPNGKWYNNRTVLFEKRIKTNEVMFTGNWKNARDKYLGLRIKKNGKYYYGWLKMSHRIEDNNATVLVISRMAIQSRPDTRIKTIDKN
ncbi:hypothetical protein EOD41_07435 [Mucilaginibacter limnophilus]|uniref:Uncharacterized protein n=1 Tax=Mucilaginibacter limnophilus TaxID=1932778 RepID=A0A437MVT8_9SPHI|nr:hypothetical protein [Mucilaginibacter limnophilus]RVU01781.1 hypothetical protein EOD41_07435 [Mucilaginibacter limnophilus]